MNRLIGDLLDVMRMESGRLALETEELTVASVLAQADESVRHLAVARHIELTVSPPDVSLRVTGDRGRLAQVFANLLGNAIKFTPEEGRVSLRAWRAGDEILFEVADTGPGMPPEHLTRLFDRFWQANRADRRGVGLGSADRERNRRRARRTHLGHERSRQRQSLLCRPASARLTTRRAAASRSSTTPRPPR